MENQIKKIRKQRRISQYKLAEMAGCSQALIVALEQGRIELSMKWMKKLSEILECKPYELLPEEWQPPVLTEEEQQLLALFRKKSGNDTSEKN